MSDYTRSNRRKTAFKVSEGAIAAGHTLLQSQSAREREFWGQKLLDLLADDACVPRISFSVVNGPRPYSTSDGTLESSTHAIYDPDINRIRAYHLTSIRQQPVAAKSFLDTVVHEFMHHWDYEAFELDDSLHTSGFFHRVGHIMKQLVPAQDT